ncbi:MAG: N-acetylmuramoyl-L-alanine amidase [Clostridia bacterium]|nr:N-acetylmuramoyl-L-alanine amidase [Clostridia bacterium]
MMSVHLKRAWWLILFCLLFLARPALADPQVYLKLNGVEVKPDSPPYIDNNGRTLVPVRFISEQLGANVDWIEREQKVLIQRQATVIELWIGKPTARVNNREVQLDTVPVLKEGTTMVPVRFISQAFGAKVDWDQASATVAIWLLPEPSASRVQIAGDWVNIRSGPGLGYEVIVTLPRGTVLGVTGLAPGWYKVSLPEGKSGWVAAGLVKVIEAVRPVPPDRGSEPVPEVIGMATVGPSPVNVRVGPGLEHPSIGEARPGLEFPVIGRQGDWLQVALANGHKGWIAGWVVDFWPLERELLKITGVEVKKKAGEILLKIVGSGSFNYKSMELSNPRRLVLDIPGAKLALSSGREEMPVNQEPVSKIRLGQYTTDTVRIVIDLLSGYSLNTEKLAAGNGFIFHITRPTIRGKKIVIDPGHGEDSGLPDPGAIGPTGVQEKDVNMAIAAQLANILKNEGVEVILTRNGDRTPLSLYGRAELANEVGADAFVSIHCNASPNPAIDGTATYFYAPLGTDLGWQRWQRQRLAQCIQNNLVAAIGRRNIGVLEANFAVLRTTAMPSVLVETAFISNPEEERLLASPDFRLKIAAGIAAGLKEYFSS